MSVRTYLERLENAVEFWVSVSEDMVHSGNELGETIAMAKAEAYQNALDIFEDEMMT